VILPFALLFAQDRTWRHAQVLLLGALLTPGQRTVCAILRMVGLRWERHFVQRSSGAEPRRLAPPNWHAPAV